jgi:lipoprotein NlpD
LTRFLICLVVAWLAGCGATRTSAPVREARSPGAAVPSLKASAPAPAGHYRVQAGDTLYKVAFEHGVDYRDLARWNKLSDPDRIRAEELLRVIPPKPPVTTAALPAEPTVSSRPIATEPVSIPDPPESPPDVWVWPSRGALLARFGEGINKGIDIGGPRGQTVQAAASGRVVYSGSGLRGYGKLIIIRHGKTLLSAYAHNARLLAAEGQTVARGQTIAEMGDSDTDRVKLHFEIREYGKPVDPLNYLPKLS